MAINWHGLMLAGVAVLGLGGCGSFRVASAPQAAVEVPEVVEARSYTQIGSQALDKQHVAAAIVAYRQALETGEDRAAALNGLAIAYWRLGRVDLSQRFFVEAIEAGPDDDRYVRNLARLMTTEQYAARGRIDLIEKLVSHALPPGEIPAGPPQQGKLSRVATGQFHIATATAPSQTGSRAYGSSRLAIVQSANGLSRPLAKDRVAEGFRPLVRIALERRELNAAQSAQAPEAAAVRLPQSRTVEFASFRPVVRFELKRNGTANGRN